jgi:light-regulated signal transduction histidine kinase (bacteriophytochrome)
VKEVLSEIDTVIRNQSAVVTVDSLPSVRIERTALAEVFLRLLSNSLEYRREGVAPRIEVTCVRRENEVCFAIRDNGMGIQADHHARIFQLFRRLHGAEYPGIGLGLPLSKRLIENCGGRMWVDSEAGVGSTFYFTLMAATSGVSAAAK